MKTKRWLALTVALLMLLVTACSAAPESTTAPEDGAPSGRGVHRGPRGTAARTAAWSPSP